MSTRTSATNRNLFVSHSSVDKPFVRMLKDDLYLLRVDVWLDERELRPGDALSDSLEGAIARSKNFIVCLSAASLSSRWVQAEIEIAMRLARGARSERVIPAILDDSGEEQMPGAISDLLYVDFRDPARYDAEVWKLARAVKPRIAMATTLPLDAVRSDRLVGHAKDENLRRWVVRYLAVTMGRRVDPAQRYWAYMTLGGIGGIAAEEAIEKGLADANGFARRGAAEARQLLARKVCDSPGERKEVD